MPDHRVHQARFHSRATRRDCRKPLTSASAPNPPSATASNSMIAIGFTKALAVARLLFQGRDRVHQILDVGVGGKDVRRHGRFAPDMRAALLYFVSELGCGVLVAFVLDGNVLE